jgi:poly(3-hydroxybutyrate) depolymerase
MLQCSEEPLTCRRTYGESAHCRGARPRRLEPAVTAYLLHEMAYAALSPIRAAAATTKLCFENSLNPMAHLLIGRSVSAACELFERTTRRYEKPAFGIDSVVIGGESVPVAEEVAWTRPFCHLIHFRKI